MTYTVRRLHVYSDFGHKGLLAYVEREHVIESAGTGRLYEHLTAASTDRLERWIREHHDEATVHLWSSGPHVIVRAHKPERGK